MLDHDYGIQEEGKQRNQNEEEIENEIHSDETHSTEEKRREDTSKEKQTQEEEVRKDKTGDTDPGDTQEPAARTTCGQESMGHSIRYSPPKSTEDKIESKKMWIFGDSLIRGVGRELHFLTSGAYRIMDRSEKGADIKRIEETLLEGIGEEHIEEDDYVLIEGGGNGLTRIGVNETLGTIERMVKKATDKVKGKVVVMNIPIRRGKENGLFGKMRRTVNIKCMEKLEEWNCDAIQLSRLGKGVG